jgi:hypothetical protein
MKKLFDIKTVCSVLVMLTVCLSSCKQDLNLQPNDAVAQITPEKIESLDIQGVTVENGVLHFKDAKSLRDAHEMLGKSNYSSVKATFEKMGFKSLEMIATEQYDVVDGLKNQEQFEAFKRTNENIFSFDNHEIKLKCYSHLMPNLINKEGLVFIGEAVHKYDEKGLIIVEDGNLEKLSRAVVSRQSSSSDKINVFDAPKLLLETRAPCGINPNTGWVNGANWRRGILSCGTEIYINSVGQVGSSTFAFDMYSFSRGQAQKYLTFFGYWTGVNTTHTLAVNQIANAWVNNAKTINITKNYNTTFSSSGVSEILFYEYLGSCVDFNAFSSSAAQANGTTLFKAFTSINNTYTNGGSVNTSIICQ